MRHLHPLLAQVEAGRTYARILGHDIPGVDLPSGGLPYTKHCLATGNNYKGKTGFAAWEAICDDTPGCVAATAPTTPDGCSDLKAAGGKDVIKENPAFVVMTTAVPPQKPCIFANVGQACTTDPYIEQPICCGGNKVPCVNGICGVSTRSCWLLRKPAMGKHACH